MENMGEWEQKCLINELTQGRELARQLQVYLNMPSSSSSSSSHETCELLVQKIQTSYEKALSMMNCDNFTTLAAEAEPQPPALAIRMPESPPPSGTASPRSGDSDGRDVKEQDQLNLDASKKRKTLPRWTQQVQVRPGAALEETLGDGFSWRKYGQKNILGAKYPRGYYRCTHRNVQGCLATKQVQRSDDDPTILEITYRGRHTCNLASHVMAGPSENHEQGTSIEPQRQHNQQLAEENQKQQQQSQDLLVSFQRSLKVIVQDSDIREPTYPSFPNYPLSTSSTKVENNVVFSPSMVGHVSPSFMSPATSGTSKVENNVVFSPSMVGNVSPSFMSPATSGTSNYFSMYRNPSGMNDSTTVRGDINFPTSDPQLTEISQAAATSATNFSTVGLNFPFHDAEFDPNFAFGNRDFFSES